MMSDLNVAQTELENELPSPKIKVSSSTESASSGWLSGDESLIDNLEIPPTLKHLEFQLTINEDSTVEALEEAEKRCKQLVLSADQFSPERKWLIRYLIELRLRLEETRDAEEISETSCTNMKDSIQTKVILGHHFRHAKYFNSLLEKQKVYCDHCTSFIWNVFQTWYLCEDCDYKCHEKCLPFLVRVCAHVIAAEQGEYNDKICPERGISYQNYKCAECQSSLTMTLPMKTQILEKISPKGTYIEGRLCDYDGKYYCLACHWNAVAVIPARVVHNWDFEMRKVCQASLQLLKLTSSRPLINLDKINPKLYGHVHELNLVKHLRKELLLMKRYLSVCRVAQENKLLAKLEKKRYMIDNSDLFSLQDLLDTKTGNLPMFLQGLSDEYAQHIKYDCEVCKGRGYRCEICRMRNNEVLYPFDDGIYECACNAIYHKHCWLEKNKECPKCIRILERKKEDSEVAEEIIY